MSDKAVCRTAPATLGLLNILVSDLATWAQKCSKIALLKIRFFLSLPLIVDGSRLQQLAGVGSMAVALVICDM